MPLGFPRRCRQKTPRMLRRRLVSLLTCCARSSVFRGSLYAQMESGDRGIAPIDSSGTLEITGIHVDVSWQGCAVGALRRLAHAQRQGFKAFWAKTHNRPVSEAPTVPDSTLDQLVSSIVVEREQIGPNRYIADLGILFDRCALGRAPRSRRRSSPVRPDAPDPGDHQRGHRHDRRAAQSVAARLGGVQDVAKPDRLCPRQRARNRPAPRQCGTG